MTGWLARAKPSWWGGCEVTIIHHKWSRSATRVAPKIMKLIRNRWGLSSQGCSWSVGMFGQQQKRQKSNMLPSLVRIQASDQAVSSVKAVPHIALPKVVDLHLCAKALVKSPAAHNFPRSQEMVEVLCLVGGPRRPWVFQLCLICWINYDRCIIWWFMTFWGIMASWWIIPIILNAMTWCSTLQSLDIFGVDPKWAWDLIWSTSWQRSKCPPDIPVSQPST